MATSKRISKIDGETKLQRVVRIWLNNHGVDYDNGWRGAYKDLAYGGCQSGLVGPLIYYTDTVRFYKRHQNEIDRLLKESLDDSGLSVSELFGDKWDDEDPLAHEQFNQNLLSWFGFEETARNIADANGMRGSRNTHTTPSRKWTNHVILKESKEIYR